MTGSPGRPRYVAVCGTGEPEAAAVGAAEEVGRLLGERGAVVICGGLGGVMEAACRGARSAGALTVGLLPGTSRADANPWVEVAIPTGLGELRNGLIVRAADALIAIGGGFGTLSEIGLALKGGKPVVALSSWELGRDELVRASDPTEAVDRALALAGGGPG